MDLGQQAERELPADCDIRAHATSGAGVQAFHTEREPVQHRGRADHGVDDVGGGHHGHLPRARSSCGEWVSVREATRVVGSAVAPFGPKMVITLAR